MSYKYRSSRAYASPPRARRPQQRNNRQVGQYIDPQRFIAQASTIEAEQFEPNFVFADLDLPNQLKSNIHAKKYVTPSPIQDQAIPAGLTGNDIIGIAGTGTGKTVAFAVPVLQRLLTDKNSSALIVAPTRELAQQIELEFLALARETHLQHVLIIGGSNIGRQLRALRSSPRIVIGTPGRIKDHLQRGSLKLHNFNMVVVDEVDRMLDMGFVNDVTQILNETSNTRQLFFFSATMDARVRRLVESFTKDPVNISIKASKASANVNQDIVRYSGNSDKMEQLHDLLIQKAVAKVIVFDETKRGVERLSKDLSVRGFSVEALHGGKSQGQRQRALAKFKKNEVNILVATDVAARGLDVVDITHVVNYSIPKQYDDYIHRIGRAGRAGQIGHALTFIAN